MIIYNGIKTTFFVFLFLLGVFGNSFCGESSVVVPKKFVIVTASYNNGPWVSSYMKALASQDYPQFRVIYYDDCSSDGTGEIAQTLAGQLSLSHKIRIIKNKKRVGAHLNIYRAIHSCDDDEIVVVVDGDDWLAHDKVLSYLNAVYQDDHVWLTYGQFQEYPSGKIGFARRIPNIVIRKNTIRRYRWVTTHLRTFYAWLYKRIDIEDLMFRGQFIRRAGDLAIMFPMVEMAGFHTKFISEVLLTYNRANEYNYGKHAAENFASKNWLRQFEYALRHTTKQYQHLKESDLAV